MKYRTETILFGRMPIVCEMHFVPVQASYVCACGIKKVQCTLSDSLLGFKREAKKVMKLCFLVGLSVSARYDMIFLFPNKRTVAKRIGTIEN
jgi:hypothetical protein